MSWTYIENFDLVSRLYVRWSDEHQNACEKKNEKKWEQFSSVSFQRYELPLFVVNQQHEVNRVKEDGLVDTGTFSKCRLNCHDFYDQLRTSLGLIV